MPAPTDLEGLAGVGFGRGWRRWKRLLTDNRPGGPFLPVSPWKGRGSDANGREREFVFLRGIRGLNTPALERPKFGGNSSAEAQIDFRAIIV